jgi:ANTAR domain-containing protein
LIYGSQGWGFESSEGAQVIGHFRSCSDRHCQRRWRTGLPVTGAGDYGESMPAGNGGMDSQWHELYAQAQAARTQSRVLAARHRAARHATAEVLQRIQAARARAEQIGELWLAARPDADGLRYSASARLQARLESMPVIEQAKGIIMAQFGWPEDQAFDALRRASQRYNIKVRDLAAKIVAQTARSASAQPQARPVSADGPASEELAPVRIPAALAGATAHRRSRHAGRRPGTTVPAACP